MYVKEAKVPPKTDARIDAEEDAYSIHDLFGKAYCDDLLRHLFAAASAGLSPPLLVMYHTTQYNMCFNKYIHSLPPRKIGTKLAKKKCGPKILCRLMKL
jgi:hypothetical protein